MQTDRINDIMDAAERRIRDAGYNGFSFRDIAADVGIKSSSVHHHFATKADLAAEVARRYTDRFYADIQEAQSNDLVTAYRTAFRYALWQENRMCLCGVLGAEIGALPEKVAYEARRFFTKGIDLLCGEPSNLPVSLASKVMASLEGALILARVLNDKEAFDRATETLP